MISQQFSSILINSQQFEKSIFQKIKKSYAKYSRSFLSIPESPKSPNHRFSWISEKLASCRDTAGNSNFKCPSLRHLRLATFPSTKCDRWVRKQQQRSANKFESVFPVRWKQRDQVNSLGTPESSVGSTIRHETQIVPTKDIHSALQCLGLWSTVSTKVETWNELALTTQTLSES